MRNPVKVVFWWAATTVFVAELVLLLAGQFLALGVLGLFFQGACLVFMREDVR